MYFVLLVIFVSSQAPAAPIIELNQVSKHDCESARTELQAVYKNSGYGEHVRVLCVPGTTASILPPPAATP